MDGNLDDLMKEMAAITGQKVEKPKVPKIPPTRNPFERAAQTLGIDPVDLATIVSFETAGTFDPNKVGGEGNKYRGLIQFGVPEQKLYYKPGQTLEDQLNDGVVRYFQDRFKKAGKDTRGATLEDLYTTVIAGNPNANRDIRDAFGTSAKSGVARMLKEHRPKVLQRFFGGRELPKFDVSQADNLLNDMRQYTENQSFAPDDLLNEMKQITEKESIAPVVPTEQLVRDVKVQPQIETLGGFPAIEGIDPTRPMTVETAGTLEPQTDLIQNYQTYLRESGNLPDTQENRKAFNEILRISQDAANKENEKAVRQGQVAQRQQTVQAAQTVQTPQTVQPASSEFKPVNVVLDTQTKDRFDQKRVVEREISRIALNNVPDAAQSDVDEAFKNQPVNEDTLSGAGRVNLTVQAGFLSEVARQRDKRIWVEKKTKEAEELAARISIPLEEAMFNVGLINREGIEEIRNKKREQEERDAPYRAEYEKGLVQKAMAEQAMFAQPGSLVIPDVKSAQRQAKMDADALLAEYGSFENYYKERREMWKRIASNPNSAAVEFTKNFARSIPKAVSSLLKSVSIGAEGLGTLTGTDERSASEMDFYKLGRWIDRKVDEFLPQDKQLSKAFILSTLPDTLGQLFTQVGAGALTGGIGAPLVLGGAMGGAEQYEEASRFGATKNQRLLAALTGAVAAAPDVLLQARWLKLLTPLEKSRFFGRFTNSVFGNAAKQVGQEEAKTITRQFVKNVLTGGTLEGLQEVSENKINDALASLTYDPERKVLTINGKDVESFIAGFIGGAAGGSLQTVLETQAESPVTQTPESPLTPEQENEAWKAEAERKLLKGATVEETPVASQADFQDVVPNEQGVYEVPTDTSPVRRKETRSVLETSETPKELEANNPLRAETPNQTAIEKLSSDSRANKIIDVLSDGQPKSVEEIAKATRYKTDNVSESLMNLFDARRVEILPDNRVRLIGDTSTQQPVSLYERAKQRIQPVQNTSPDVQNSAQTPINVEKTDVQKPSAPVGKNEVLPKTENVSSETRPTVAKEPTVADELNRFDVENRQQKTLAEQDREFRENQAAQLQKEQAEREARKAKVIKEPFDETGARRVYTVDNKPVKYQPKVIDASDLLTSADADYPQEFQPKDIKTAQSKEQIDDITRALNPEMLDDDIKASDGRPLVVPVKVGDKIKYAVISGNHRSEAIKTAYEYKTGYADEYKEFANQKEKNSFARPVYVGVLDPNIDIKDFAQKANKPSVADYTATEKALTDADVLDDATMAKFVPSEDGKIHSAANRQFITGFFEKLPPTERRALQMSDGSLSEKGVERVRNAILAKTFGKSENLLKRMLESPDNDIKKITNSLLKVAGKFADLKQKTSDGIRFAGLDISDDIAVAVNKYGELKADGTDVATYLAQRNMFGEELSPFQKRLVTFFDKFRGSQKAMSEIMSDYLDLAEQFGNPQQKSIIDSFNTIDAPSFFEAAVKEYESRQGRTEQRSLLDQDQGRKDEPGNGQKSSPLFAEETQEITPELAKAVLADIKAGKPLPDIAEKYNITPEQMVEIQFPSQTEKLTPTEKAKQRRESGTIGEKGEFGQISHKIRQAMFRADSNVLNDLAKVFEPDADLSAKNASDAVLDAIAAAANKERSSQLSPDDWNGILNTYADRLSDATIDEIIKAIHHQDAWFAQRNALIDDPELIKILDKIDFDKVKEYKNIPLDIRRDLKTLFDKYEKLSTTTTRQIFDDAFGNFQRRIKEGDIERKGRADEREGEAPGAIEDDGFSFTLGGENKPLAPNGKPSNLSPKLHAMVRTPEFKRWFGDWENDPQSASKVVDENGEPLVVFSGHGNIELYGDKYVKKNATAGGFYATESTEIASGYASGKLGNYEEYSNGSQYRFKLKNGKWDKKLWQIEFTPEQQQIVREYVRELGYDLEQYWRDNARYDAEARRAMYRGLKDPVAVFNFLENMGENVVYPSRDENATWEEKNPYTAFEDILNKTGIDWRSAERAQPGVFPLFLNIRNQIDSTAKFPQDLLKALEQKAARSRDSYSANNTQWTRDYPMKEWVERIKEGDEYWSTQIPAKALPILQEFGYDGIRELGSKGAVDPKSRQVNWIAFEPNQIKSVFNRGTFDSTKDSILFALTGGKPISDARKTKLLSDYKTQDKRLSTISNYLSKKDWKELTKANAEVKDGVLHLNPEALAVFRKLYKLISGKTTGFTAFYAAPNAAEAVQKALSDVTNSQKGKPAYKTLKRLEQAVERAMLNDYGDLTAVVSAPGFDLIEKYTKQEELSHRADYRVRNFTNQEIAPYEELDGYRQARNNLKAKGYEGDRQIHNEIIGKLGRDDADSALGLTWDQIDEIEAFHLGQLANNGVTAETYRSHYSNISERAEKGIEKYERLSKQTDTGDGENDAGTNRQDGAAVRSPSDLRGGSGQRGTKTLERTEGQGQNRFLDRIRKAAELSKAERNFVEKRLDAFPKSERDAVELVKDKEGRLLAPNGKRSNLTEHQWRTVRTPSFKKFFGDWENDPQNASKVVDENGEPLVVYHGTPKGDLEKFDASYLGNNTQYPSALFGFAATPNKEYADSYGFNKPTKKTFELFVNIRKPRTIDYDYYAKHIVPNASGSDPKLARAFRQETERGGYDGIIVVMPRQPRFRGGKVYHPPMDKLKRGEMDEIFAFQPNQIKSVFNRGTFDSALDEISFAKASTSPAKDYILSALKSAKKDTILDIISSVKSLKATADLSAAGRQGWILSLTHPRMAFRSFIKQLKSLNQKQYQNFKTWLNLHPSIELAEASDLYLSTLADASDLNEREEAFMSRLFADDPYFKNRTLEKIRRGATYPIRKAEDAYKTYLDNLRIETFTLFAQHVHERLKRDGVTDNEAFEKEMKGVARFVNFATGRGNWGSPTLNATFFSTRYWESRVQLLNPFFYTALPPKARNVALKNMAGFVGATALLLLLWDLGGGDIEWDDPNDPNTLKLKWGNYSYDISAGLVSHLRYFARLASLPFEDQPKQGTKAGKAWYLTERYGRSKLSPVAGSTVNWLTGENFIGEPTSLEEEVLGRDGLIPGFDPLFGGGLTSPMQLNNFYEAAKADGTLGLIKVLPEFVGFGVTRFKSEAEYKEEIEKERAKIKPNSTKEERKEIQRRIKAWQKLIKRSRRFAVKDKVKQEPSDGEKD